MTLTGRSRTLEMQRCPRARFIQYEWGGRGVVSPGPAIELVTGAATHVGVGGLLEGLPLEEAVRSARASFDREFGRSINDPTDPLAYVRAEQTTLVEMLVRLYHARQLPRLLEEFEVLSVEREIVLPLLTGFHGGAGALHDARTECGKCRWTQRGEIKWKDFQCPNGCDPQHWQVQYGEYFDLGWMARADAILRRRADGGLYVHSLKTCNEFSERKDEENRLDMQGVSELAAVEHLMGERVQGVKMEFLVKGKRDRYSKYLQDSPLVRPWRKQEQFEVAWSWCNRIPCENPAECKYHRKRPSDNPYHELTAGWERVPVWEHMTPCEWFERLASGEVQPGGDPFEGLVVTPVPYYRNAEDVERWRRQVTAQEARTARAATVCNRALTDGVRVEATLDEHFPQYKRSCVWPNFCSYYERDSSTCLGTGAALLDPMGNGLTWRRPHHSTEVINEANTIDAQSRMVYTKEGAKE